MQTESALAALPTRSSGLTNRDRAIRTTGIGASEIAAIVGLHPARKPIDVYAEKVGLAEPFEGNTFTEWGNRLEAVVAQAYAEKNKVCVFKPGTQRHHDPRFPFALATPDRAVVPGRHRARAYWQRLLEIKNVSVFRADDFGEGGDAIPEHMLAQVQWQLEVCDLDEAVLVPLIGGNDYREYPVKRDREFGGLLLDIAGRFWTDNVLKQVAPPVDGSSGYTEYLRRRFPKDAGPVLEPTDEARALVARLRAAKAAKKVAEEAETLAANELRALIGEAAGVAGICTLKLQAGSSYTVTREPTRVLRLAKEK